MTAPIIIFLFGLSIRIGLLYQILETRNSLLLICVLAPLLGANYSLSGGQVDCTDACLDLVYILTALAAAAEGIKNHLTRIELSDLSNSASTKVNKPVFALMLRSIRAPTHPLDRAEIWGKIRFRVDPDRAESSLIVSGRRVNDGYIIVLLQMGQQLCHTQLAFGRTLTRADLIDHSSPHFSPALKL